MRRAGAVTYYVEEVKTARDIVALQSMWKRVAT